VRHVNSEPIPRTSAKWGPCERVVRCARGAVWPGICAGKHATRATLRGGSGRKRQGGTPDATAHLRFSEIASRPLPRACLLKSQIPTTTTFGPLPTRPYLQFEIRDLHRPLDTFFCSHPVARPLHLCICLLISLTSERFLNWLADSPSGINRFRRASTCSRGSPFSSNCPPSVRFCSEFSGRELS